MVGVAALTVGIATTEGSVRGHLQENQGKILPKADIILGRDLKLRELVVQEALLGAGVSSIGLFLVIPTVFGRRRERQLGI